MKLKPSKLYLSTIFSRQLHAKLTWVVLELQACFLEFMKQETSHQLETQLQLISKTRWKSVAYLLEPLLIRSSIKRLQKEDRGPHREPCQTDPKIFFLNFLPFYPCFQISVQKAKKAENGCIYGELLKAREGWLWSDPKIRRMLYLCMNVKNATFQVLTNLLYWSKSFNFLDS